MSKLAPNEYRLSGMVKFYSPRNGYGFIETADGDVFFHAETMQQCGYDSVLAGAKATCVAVKDNKGLRALKVDFERKRYVEAY